MNRDQVISRGMRETSAGTAAEKTAVGTTTNDPWVVAVDVWLQPDGSDPPFVLETYLPKNAHGEIVFENHRRDGFIINFNLQDPHGTGYLFPNDLKEALYSAAGRGCPTNKGQWPQFEARSVTNGNRTLEVRNRNQGKQVFGYTLRVTKTGGAPYLDLDPGGENQNGGSS